MKKFKLKEALPIGISTAGLGISAANYITNKKRLKESNEYQEKQLEAMDRLTSSLNKVDGSLKKIPAEKKQSKKGFKFFQKNNSHTANLAYKGAIAGGTLMGGAIPFIPDHLGSKVEEGVTTFKPGKEKDKPSFENLGVTNENGDTWTRKISRNNDGVRTETSSTRFTNKGWYNNLNPFYKKALLELGGIAIGAGLGAFAGMIMDVSDYLNKKQTVNNRLLKDVIDNLKKIGYKEGQSFTRDPKMASLLKTKVCLVISKSSDELKLLINTVKDAKLKTLTGQITKNLPTMSTLTEKVSDRFNEINITTMTSNSGDAVWVTSVAEKFISAGYPVYLVEVG